MGWNIEISIDQNKRICIDEKGNELKASGGAKSLQVNKIELFSSIRIIQTGKRNNGNDWHFILSGFEIFC
jgi:hypothetical protein